MLDKRRLVAAALALTTVLGGTLLSTSPALALGTKNVKCTN